MVPWKTLTFSKKWDFETVEERALHEYAQEMSTDIVNAIDGNTPLKLFWVNNSPQREIITTHVSGAAVSLGGAQDFDGEPLKEDKNWVNIGIASRDFGGISMFAQDRLRTPLRLGNDQNAIENPDGVHEKYHEDIFGLKLGLDSSVPRNTRLEKISYGLGKKLFSDYVYRRNLVSDILEETGSE